MLQEADLPDLVLDFSDPHGLTGERGQMVDLLFADSIRPKEVTMAVPSWKHILFMDTGNISAIYVLIDGLEAVRQSTRRRRFQGIGR